MTGMQDAGADRGPEQDGSEGMREFSVPAIFALMRPRTVWPL